jgi:hypothetical protein
LLKNDIVLGIIHDLNKKLLRSMTSGALKSLGKMIKDDNIPASVKLNGIICILDRGGLKNAEVLEIVNNLTPRQREDRIKELERQRELLLNANKDDIDIDVATQNTSKIIPKTDATH